MFQLPVNNFFSIPGKNINFILIGKNTLFIVFYIHL
jgi:hypothetical protein